jgi:hypothetical protein
MSVQEKKQTAARTLETGPSDLSTPQHSQPSRFTQGEKWFIVGFTACVGLFRYTFIMLPSNFETDFIAVHCHLLFTSQQYPPL